MILNITSHSLRGSFIPFDKKHQFSTAVFHFFGFSKDNRECDYQPRYLGFQTLLKAPDSSNSSFPFPLKPHHNTSCILSKHISRDAADMYHLLNDSVYPTLCLEGIPPSLSLLSAESSSSGHERKRREQLCAPGAGMGQPIQFNLPQPKWLVLPGLWVLAESTARGGEELGYFKQLTEISLCNCLQ